MLLHTAGVPGLGPQISPEDLCECDRVCAFIADEPPWWQPGTKTFGFVLGELVRRATLRTFRATLREVITAPLGVADEPGVQPTATFANRVGAQPTVSRPTTRRFALGRRV